METTWESDCDGEEGRRLQKPALGFWQTKFLSKYIVKVRFYKMVMVMHNSLTSLIYFDSRILSISKVLYLTFNYGVCIYCTN